MTRPASNRAEQESTDGLIVRGRPRFAMTPTSLLRNPTISSRAVRLWSVLASYTYGDRATDRPSRSQLASDVGWKSVRSVDTYLAELQGTGYLTIQHQWRADRGQSRSLYILEWEPRSQKSPACSEPVESPVCPAHTGEQDPARGGTAPVPPISGKPVSADRDTAQCSARGTADRGTPAQNPARASPQDSAHLRKESTTKKELPPAGSGQLERPRSNQSPVNSSGPAEPLVRVIREGLPDRLHSQLANSTLTVRATLLARAGWTDTALAVAMTRRTWAGAGPGAVVTWLTDLAAVVPPRVPARPEDARTATFRLRARDAADRLASAGPESRARQQARELAASLGKRSQASDPRS